MALFIPKQLQRLGPWIEHSATLPEHLPKLACHNYSMLDVYSCRACSCTQPLPTFLVGASPSCYSPCPFFDTLFLFLLWRWLESFYLANFRLSARCSLSSPGFAQTTISPICNLCCSATPRQLAEAYSGPSTVHSKFPLNSLESPVVGGRQLLVHSCTPSQSVPHAGIVINNTSTIAETQLGLHVKILHVHSGLRQVMKAKGLMGAD